MGPTPTPWQEQWKRVLRWFLRFSEATRGRVHVDDRESDTYHDDAYAFFVACFHLKDWLKHDPSSQAAAHDVEKFVSGSSALSLCADIANGSKHLSLTRPRVDAKASIGRRKYELHLGQGRPKLAVRYEITAAGKTHDAFELAERCVAEWEAYLAKIGLPVDT